MHITRESVLNINGEKGKRAENDYKLREKQWTDRKSKKRKKDRWSKITVYPRSSYPFYEVSYHIKWVKYFYTVP